MPGRRTRRVRQFTARGRHGPLSGTEYPNGTIVYQWDAAPGHPSIVDDMEQLEKNQRVKAVEYHD